MRGALYPLSPSRCIAYGLRPGGAPAVARRSSSRVAGRPKPALPAAARCHRLGDGFSSPSRRGSGPARLRSPFFSARSGASGADVGAIDAPGVPVDPGPVSSSLQTQYGEDAGEGAVVLPAAKTVVDRLPRAVAFPADRASLRPCSLPEHRVQQLAVAAPLPPRPPFAGKIGSTRRHWASLNS